MDSFDTPRRFAHQQNLQPYTVRAETLLDLLSQRSRPQREALILMDLRNEAHPVMAGDILAKARKAAQFLMAKELKKGDTVVLMLPTSVEFLYLFFGILLAGGIPVPVSQATGPGHQEKHLAHVSHIIRDCEAKFFITYDRMEMIVGASEQLKPLTTQFLFADEILRHAAAARGTESPPSLAASDVALIQYTSGTTSRPKGVVLTHANIIHNIHTMGIAVDTTPDEVTVSWLPLYHDMGLTGALLTVFYWNTMLILMRPEAFIFKPQWWLQNISRFKATISVAPNFGYHYCLSRIEEKELEGLDLSSWRLALNGAEPIDRVTLKKFHDRFERYGLRSNIFLPVYGMAENSLAATFPALDKPTVVRRFHRGRMQEELIAVDCDSEDPKIYIDLVAVGHPLLGQEVKIIDDQGATMLERHIGQILIKGPSLTQGYYKNSDATREAIQDGWLHTGDLGFMLDSQLFISGRIKEMIIKRGKNIYPYDVERAATAVNGVRLGSCVAFAVENKDSGTEDLVLVCESNYSGTEAITALKKEIANHMLATLGFAPDRIVVAAKGAVPKTTSGKVQRVICKKMYLDGLFASFETLPERMSASPPAAAV
ncbi:MAG: fatty acyl-AMP ligase [Desulfobacteraceae bacterium]|nr:fatty acyl-AMP ligase [Desulfobacteraceae bacterium]